MMIRNILRLATLVIFTLFGYGCGNKEEATSPMAKVGVEIVDTLNRQKRLPRFVGNYVRELNDLHDAHLSAAQVWGISPLKQREDTSQYQIGKELIRISSQTELFRVDDLRHSVPYLVPQAARLLSIIAKDFRDSLISKKLPLYRIVVTSVTRTTEDVQSLMRHNRNAIPTSVHCYGTTFDISWKRYDLPMGLSKDQQSVSADKLKFILGQVLFNLRNRGLCYVKYERKQACYHITAR